MKTRYGKYIKNHSAQAGFTLIELLVVIAIIGILASVILASLNSARAKARDARRAEDMEQITTALAMFYNDHGCLPRTSGSTCISGYSEADTGGWDYSTIGGFMTFLKAGGYMPEVPVDPTNSGSMLYRYYCYPGATGGPVLAYWKEDGTYVRKISGSGTSNADTSYSCN